MSTESARIAAALVAGVGTVGYYATPDLLRSRRARGWAKAACLLVVTAAGVPEAYRGWQATRADAPGPVTPAAGPVDGPSTDDPSADGPSSDDPSVDGAGTGPADAAPGPLAEAWRSLSPGGRAALTGGALVAAAASVALTVGMERALFRRGEARRAAGARLPHTRTGLALGVVATALAMYPDPAERSR